ncbi:hypothetical protein FOWG_17195 [Fusarium oxysporum f. sp. lycopersici MN25]|nr:hypothetical protein FOWG_17195 [Fusarium oxysporum f. sp. lycopersici MN25]
MMIRNMIKAKSNFYNIFAQTITVRVKLASDKSAT